MPYHAASPYRPGPLFKSGHFSTIYAGVVRTTTAPAYHREKWTLPDGDFLLVDSAEQNPEKAVILCHGLEGSSRSSYINSAAHYFLRRGYSVFAWNNRGCGGELNRLPKLYHHASIEDLAFVVETVIDKGYNSVFLLGFSLGGAQILSYFGQQHPPLEVKAGGAVSTPIWLKSSARQIETGFSRLYARRFIKKIRTKILAKAARFPDLFAKEDIRLIRSFEDLARTFIVPIHGFKNLEDYYLRASPGYSIEEIKTQVLILNALNDPLIGPDDFPVEVAAENENIVLETPRYGGHCAFLLPGKDFSYADQRMAEFFKTVGG